MTLLQYRALRRHCYRACYIAPLLWDFRSQKALLQSLCVASLVTLAVVAPQRSRPKKKYQCKHDPSTRRKQPSIKLSCYRALSWKQLSNQHHACLPRGFATLLQSMYSFSERGLSTRTCVRFLNSPTTEQAARYV